MRIYRLKPSTLFFLTAAIALGVLGAACQPATNTNSNANANAVANTNTAPANVNAAAPVETASIAAREPEKYRATLVLSAETEGGDKTIGIPTLSAEVARNGADRRVSFKLPDGSNLIYLDHADHHYVIAPGRKQYAELTTEALGFQVQKLMTPGQIVSYLEKVKGVQRVGEETINGRDADKYSYASTVKTGTQAGDVSNQAYVYVDKETGLPLRSELFTEASSSVKGVKGAKIVAEMRDIVTNIDSATFEVPPGLDKVPPEKVRAQIDALTATVATVLKALLTNINAQSSPAASPSPVSPAASPKSSN
jgi:hypothetical protein